MVFAREVTPGLTSLVKKLDEATAANKKQRMGSFVVFLTKDTDELEPKLKELAKKENLKQTVLAMDNPAGPKGHKVAKDADVTVVLYVNRAIKANYAFRKGEMKSSDVEAIVKDLSKILK